MKTIFTLTTLALTLLAACTQVAAIGDELTATDRILGAMNRLSEATAPDGSGVEAYAEVLATDFSRWTVGSSKMSNKSEWLDGVREWYDDGWRVSDRQQEIQEIRITGDMAFTRRTVKETYLGPNGDQSTSKAGLAETWVRNDSHWLLWRVNVSVLKNDN